MKNLSGVLLLLLCGITTRAQEIRIEPPNWWVGMKSPSIQLMVHGDSISQYNATLNYDGVTLVAVNEADSPNYVFLDLAIAPKTKPGTLKITWTKNGQEVFTSEFQLKKRLKDAKTFEGFNSSDAIYLITPDRFANGDRTNDVVPYLKEATINRSHDYKRHGGDIRGIIEHLDYIDQMGFTAIWSSPLLINDMEEQSYHGYAITDFYHVDPRFGTLDEYAELAQKAKQRGIKLIMDQVANHCGSNHWWMKDLPFNNWINYQPQFEEAKTAPITNHRRTVNQDAYASAFDREKMEKGWFVPSMPDLNQANAFMAKYLTQNSIWWIETLQLGGIRQDTYPYPNKDFMANWAKDIMTEYPNFTIVGEEWSYNPLLVAYWQDGAANKDGYRSYLRSTMDFPMQKALIASLINEESWDRGLIQLYESLANDFIYNNPSALLFFGDNHDMDRIFTQLEEDVDLLKMALSFIALAPRIPQFYYGTEVLLQNSEKPGDHGLIRTDLPGGWPNDTQNTFSGKGLEPKQKEIQDFLKTLLNFRKSSKAIHEGATVHFAPEDGTYLIARYDATETVILLINKNEEEKTLNLSRFKELKLQGKRLRNLFTKQEIVWDTSLNLGPKDVVILSTATH